MHKIVKGIISQAAVGSILRHKTNYTDVGMKSFKDLSDQNPTPLIDCSAFVPTGQLRSQTMKEDDIYIFAYLTGKINTLLRYSSVKQYKLRTVNNRVYVSQ
jgi:hypothetical protein